MNENQSLPFTSASSPPDFKLPSYLNLASEIEFLKQTNFKGWVNKYKNFEARVASKADITSQTVENLGEFIARSAVNTNSRFDMATITFDKEMKRTFDLQLPPLNIKNLYEDYMGRLGLNMTWMIFGFRDAKSPMHTDIWSTSTWNLLLCGKKKWRIVSINGDKEYSITQRPGDVLHLPTGWAHEVTHIYNSVSVTENYVQPEHWKIVSQHQKEEGLLSLANITRSLGEQFQSASY